MKTIQIDMSFMKSTSKLLQTSDCFNDNKLYVNFVFNTQFNSSLRANQLRNICAFMAVSLKSRISLKFI